MNPHPDFERSIQLMNEQIRSLQRELGYVMSGKSLIVNNVNFPKHPEETKNVRHGVKQLLEGALLVYLFAMWESHVPDDVNTWLTESEQEKLDAFAHVRDSAAHKYQGGRASHARKKRAFERQMPFAGILWSRDSDTIDIADSSVSMQCYHLMDALSRQLVVRLYKNERPPRSAA